MNACFQKNVFLFFIITQLCCFSIFSMSEDDSHSSITQLATYRYLDRRYDNGFSHMAYLNEIFDKHSQDPDLQNFFNLHADCFILFSLHQDNREEDKPFQLFIPGEMMLLIELASSDYVKKHFDIYNSLNIPDEKGRLPIHYLSIRRNNDTQELCRWMLRNDAEIDGQDHSGKTPLHWAVLKKNYNLSEYLLSKKANSNIQDVDGNTPLHYAVGKNDESFVTLLLDRGADRTIKNNSALNPCELAYEEGSLRLYNMLSNYSEFISYNEPKKKSARHHRKKKKLSKNGLNPGEIHKIKNNKDRSKSSRNLHNRLKKSMTIKTKDVFQKILARYNELFIIE